MNAASRSTCLYWIALAWSLATTTAGCEKEVAATQTMVRVDAATEVRAVARRLRVSVFEAQGTPLESLEFFLRASDRSERRDFPVRIPLVPRGGDSSRGFRVEAELFGASDALLGRKSVAGGYKANQLQTVLLMFGAECLEVPCVEPRPGPGGVDGGPEVPDAGRVPDAGTPDAGPNPCTDGVQNGDETGVDCGGSLCARCGSGCATTLAGGYFCEGLDDLPGTWTEGSEAVADRTTVFSGTGSVRFTATDASGDDLGRWNIPNAPTTGTVFFRGYFRWASGGSFSQLTILSIGSTTDPPAGASHRIALVLRPDGYTLFNGMASDAYNSGMSTVPRDEWLCAQLEVTVDPTAGALRLWIDGEEKITQSNINTMAFEGYDFVNVGTIVPIDVTGTVVLHVDDVALGDRPIGCD